MRNKRTFLHCVSNNSRECVLEYDPVMDGPLDFYVKSERWRVVQEFFTEQLTSSDPPLHKILHRFAHHIKPGLNRSIVYFVVSNTILFQEKNVIKLDNWIRPLIITSISHYRDECRITCCLLTDNPDEYIPTCFFQEAQYLRLA